jgi:hypothetical protein
VAQKLDIVDVKIGGPGFEDGSRRHGWFPPRLG